MFDRRLLTHTFTLRTCPSAHYKGTNTNDSDTSTLSTGTSEYATGTAPYFTSAYAFELVQLPMAMGNQIMRTTTTAAARKQRAKQQYIAIIHEIDGGDARSA